MNKKHTLIGIFVASLLLGGIPILSLAAPIEKQSAQPALTEGELLRNGHFEEDWSAASSHAITRFPEGGGLSHEERGNIFTPPGWVTWFRHNPGKWDQPEVTDAHKTIDARRVHSGDKGVRFFTYWRSHDGGFYQVVSGLEPGSTVQLSAYGAAWSCSENNNGAVSCTGDLYDTTMAVGIEPNGEINPYSPNAVWSPLTPSYDILQLIGPVTAQVGEGGTVTVFLRSVAKFAYEHNDAYWDDASLTYASPPAEPTSAAPAPPASSGPPPAPIATATPHPDGSVVHTVQYGETLFGISLAYNVPLEQIRQLNASALGGSNIIRVGQTLVISLPSETSVPTSPPPSTPAEAAAGEGDTSDDTGGTDATEEQPAQETTGVSICVSAYHDRDGNGVRGDASIEELLNDAQIRLADDNGVINQYTTDGVNEPHCFTRLVEGTYRVIQDPPPGYVPSGSAEQTVALLEGASADVQFGNVREGEDAAPTGNTTNSVTNVSEEEPNWLRSAFSTLFKVGGVLVLLACAGGAVLFVLNQRKMSMM